MNIQYSIDNTSARYSKYQTKMMANVVTMASTMRSTKPASFDFEKLNKVLEKFEEVNNQMVEAQEASQSSFFNTNFGRVVHVVFDIGCIFVGLGVGGLGIYAKFTDPENTDDTLLGTTMTASFALIGKGGKDLWKNYNDYEATVVAKQKPMDPEKVTRIKEMAARIDRIIHLTGPEAKAALEEYQRIYPSLPSRIKKILPDPENWDASIVGKIDEVIGPILGEDHDGEHRIEIAEGSDSDGV